MEKIKKEILEEGLNIIQKRFPKEKESYQRNFQFGEEVFVDLAICKARRELFNDINEVGKAYLTSEQIEFIIKELKQRHLSTFQKEKQHNYR